MHEKQAKRIENSSKSSKSMQKNIQKPGKSRHLSRFTSSSKPFGRRRAQDGAVPPRPPHATARGGCLRPATGATAGEGGGADSQPPSGQLGDLGGADGPLNPSILWLCRGFGWVPARSRLGIMCPKSLSSRPTAMACRGSCCSARAKRMRSWSRGMW